MKPTVIVLQLQETTAKELFGDDENREVKLNEKNAERVVYSPKYDCYIIETVHPSGPQWWRHKPKFLKSVDYLKCKEGVLPDLSVDLTEEINKR